MDLSSLLSKEFAKITNDKKEVKNETTVYGTTVQYQGKMYVQIDGSELLTPVATTAGMEPGERVTLMIKNHSATVTGNLTSPSARTDDVKDAVDKISEFEILVAYRMKTEDFEATNAIIERLATKLAEIGQLDATEAEIETLRSDYAALDYVTANEVDALRASIEKLEVKFGSFAGVSADDMEVLNAEIENLKSYNAGFTYVSADVLSAIKSDLQNADIKYASIDFANIGQATMEYFYAKSGLIENVTIQDGTITGALVGVTLKGDLIEANTLVADKLVMRGEDGLFYKLNTDGMTVSAEQTEYNSLNGRVILAKSITAEKVSVSDLVAFDATIGGFNITENAIFSEIKDSEGNTTRGIYMDTDGQMNFGDEHNFVRYYKDDEGGYHLAISADTIMYDINGSKHSLSDLGMIGEYVKIGVYEGEPCIELGETDSDFKVLITNTRILFMEGSGTIAYVSNQALHIKKAVIEEELQQGEFVWKVRANGNMGLMWIGGNA